MEEMINKYKDVNLKVEDFRDLSEQDRKVLVQRFIDQVIYDVERFKIAIRVLEKWENSKLDQLNDL